MKKITLLLSLIAFVYVTQAQVNTPQPSPAAKIEQKVGLTDISITYSRPSMRGRTIFGDLVPYDKVWRTGANANTVITFSDDVKLGSKTLKKGAYAIYTKPGKQNWEVMFYTDTNNPGLPREWDNNKIAASINVKVMPVPFDVETFTIDFNNLTNRGANLEFIWERAYVAIPIEVPTMEKVVANIEETMAGPSQMDYYFAAVYYREEKKELKKAQQWIDKAIEMNGENPFWMLRQKALIHAAMGDKKEAIKAAKASLAGAEKVGNQDYIRSNKKSIAEWGTK